MITITAAWAAWDGVSRPISPSWLRKTHRVLGRACQIALGEGRLERGVGERATSPEGCLLDEPALEQGPGAAGVGVTGCAGESAADSGEALAGVSRDRHAALGREDVDEDVLEGLGVIVVEVEAQGEARGEARVDLEESGHLGGVARRHHDDLAAPRLHEPQRGR